MKIIVTGSLGHISKPLTRELVQKGHTVTVVSSKANKQADIEALGAIAAIGTLEDVDFLTTTFTGADAVYTMIPPNYHFDANLDLIAYCRILANNFAQAISRSGVKRVVHLSSIGAHLEAGSGLIAVHNEVQKILDKLPGVAITFMRPVAFYYNLLNFINVIKSTGRIVSNYGADDRLPWVSPIDIAAAVAEELQSPQVKIKFRYVASDDLTCNQIAGILGAAIGKPDLQWVLITDEEMQRNLEAVGMHKQLVSGFVEMNAAIHSGLLSEDYFHNRPAIFGKVKMTDYAKEFAAAFNQK